MSPADTPNSSFGLHRSSFAPFSPALFSTDSFLTSTNAVSLHDGQADFAFQPLLAGPLTLAATAPGLTSATQQNLFIRPYTPPAPPTQAAEWKGY
jgi:hypothetical protein